MGQPPTVEDLIEYYTENGKAPCKRTVENWIKKFGFRIDKNNKTVVKEIP